MKRRSVACATLLLCGSLLNAQVRWSGIYDFEIKKGGTASKPELNELPNDNLQISSRNVQLFFDAAIDNGISFSSKIAAGRRGTSDAVNIELAYVTFSGLAGNILNISAGKIMTPFGLFTRRQLSPDNPLIGDPLFFFYQTNVSAASGYLDSTGASQAQSLYGGKLSTLYTGGYYVGAEAFGSFADDLLQYDVALMNAPLSSVNSGVNLDKQLSVHGRVALHPAIWGTLGVSYCSGSFMERGNVNAFLDSSGGTERFKQSTTGLDLTLSYLFYEINAEYIINRFNAPYVVFNYSIFPPRYESGLTGTDELILSSGELLVDLKIDAPFYPGLYLAGRYNSVMFDNIVDPAKTSASFGKEIPWEHNVQKYAVALGYKPARGILIKVGYEWTKVEVTPRPDLDVFGTQLSVSF